MAWQKFVHSLCWGDFGLPNCNISFIVDQSTNKTTNEWLVTSSVWENLSYFGSLAICLATKPQCGVVRKVRINILFADHVCFKVQCLPRSAHFKILLIFVILMMSLHPWRFELEFCPKLVTLWTSLQIPLWSKPHLVFRHNVYEIVLSEVLATQMGVTEAQHQSQLVWTVQIWPIFASQRVDSVGTRA